MADHTDSKDTKATQESSVISETISEVIKNSAQVDIAKQLGLFDDDPTTLMDSALDTSGMLDPTPPLTLNSSFDVSTNQTVDVKKENVLPTSTPSSSEALAGSQPLRSTIAVNSSCSTQAKITVAPTAVSSQQPAVQPQPVKTSVKSAGVAPPTKNPPTKKPPTKNPPTKNPPTTSSSVADLASFVQSLIGQQQMLIATAAQKQSSTPILGSTLSPIPKGTHIPHAIATKSSDAGQKLGVGQVGVASQTSQAPMRSTLVSSSTSTSPASVSSLSTANKPTVAMVSGHVTSKKATTVTSSTSKAATTSSLPLKTANKPLPAKTIASPLTSTASTTTTGASPPAAKKPKRSDSPPGAKLSSSLLSTVPALAEVKLPTPPPQEEPAVANVTSSKTVSQTSVSTKPPTAVLPSSSATVAPSSSSTASLKVTSTCSAASQTISKQSVKLLQPSPKTPVQVPAQRVVSSPSLRVQTAKLPSSSSSSSPLAQRPSTAASSAIPKVAVSMATATMVTAATPSKAVQTPKSMTSLSIVTPPTTATSTTKPPAVGSSGGAQVDVGTSTAPKGLNLPILQFLQANFPALQLGDTSKDVFQVQTLLAHVLQQQQQLQQLQQQAQQQVQKAVASGQTSSNSHSAVKTTLLNMKPRTPVATPSPPSSASTPTPTSSAPAQPVKPVKPVKPVSSGSSPMLSSSSSTASSSSSSSTVSPQVIKQRSPMPVFAQVLPQVSSGGATKVTISQGMVGRPSPIVIPKQLKIGAGAYSSPLLLSRQKTKVQTTLASIPAPSPTPTSSSSTLTASLTTPSQSSTPTTKKEGGSAKLSARTAAKQQHLTKTLVEPVDAEPMDLDVGEPFTILELPPHLRDHSYSCYNPVEGEKVAKQRPQSIRVLSGIPPARVSYAPPLPDSPNTLYKLLKVLPKKTTSRRSSTTSTKTPSRRNRSGRFTPSGGGRSRRPAAASGGVIGRGNSSSRGGRGDSKPSSRGASEEPSASSESESSENEAEMLKAQVERRRSQRTAGKRKRYVDDINISFSDEELQEGIMNPTLTAKKEYKGYGDDDDSEYDQAMEGTPGAGGGTNGGGRQSKAKVVLNPTEGFHHSDVYFEPPPEEANVVERILSMRTRQPQTDEERKKHNGDEVEEFYVKYKNYSYLHAEWCTFDKLMAGDKRFDGKVKRFKIKQATMMANVDDELFNPEYTMADRVLDVATQTEPNGDIVTHYLVKWRSLPYEEATWELEEDTDPEAVRKFNKLQMVPPDDELQFKPRPNPALFKSLKECKEYRDGNKLRPYQLEGVNWLLFNWFTRQNCILADEMGLGKTVQSIAVLNEIHEAGIRGPFLVIAPLSTIANWQREFESWSEFNVVIYHGSVYSRRLINEYELYYRDTSGKIVPDAFKFNVIVTTYEVMLADESELQSIQWRVVIIDEAHRLKNRNCKLLEGLKCLDLEHRVLLTGTPLQNSVEELFSLLNFLEPSTFPSHFSFLQQFGELKSEEQVEELKTILKPMMLRRLKEDVEKSLAPKEETIVEVELTVIQKQYYRAILERNFTFLSKGGPSAVPSLLNVMMELRKCCNHPFLIKGAEQQIVDDFLRRHGEITLTNSVLVQASGKLVLIDKLLPKLRANGHKVLIFSQMVRVLDILEDYLRMKGYLYERIDGNVRGILRQEAIDRFSKPSSDRFVFLLCTRAGGLGINLTAADTVIIYDSDWNPQNDLQAQARCHRIGQNKAVKVYRLITRNTYEREMFNRASLKLGLDKAVLQSMHGNQSSSSSNGAPQMSKREIEDLLRKGAYGAIMEEDDDANQFCEEDIDQILERRTHVIQLESEAKGSSFAKASFVAEGSSDINVDDPDFWQKWAEKAKLDLDELANKDSLVLDTPRLRRKVTRYGNDNLEEIVDMSDAIDQVTDILPSKGKHGWTKLECLRVEKGLLVYGWGDWMNILRNGKFKKRQLGLKDIENIARTMLVYCLVHFTGDEKVPPYINRLINPAIVTEERSDDDKTLSSFYQDFDEEDFLTLSLKDPETLFQDSTYMKHLRRHANKILLRVRQLHLLRWSMLSQHFSKIMKGAPAKSLNLSLPRPEEPPPAPWWNVECDHSLLVGIIKHGYEQFGKMRSDPALCFKALCGEEPPTLRKKKKMASKSAAGGKVGGASEKGEESDASDSGEEEESEGEGDGESGPSTPATPSSKRSTRSAVNLKPGQYPWPSLAEVNTRARRYISAWLKRQRKEEMKQAQLLKEKERREREAEVSRKKEQKKAELAQKWSKREEQDFVRVISYFGVEFQPKANKYNWAKFRQLASLTKKSDERLTLYLHDFKQMCWRVLKRKKIKKGLSGIKVEPVNEERASRCLQRINLLSAVREEILPHPNFNQLIQLCELSFEVPQWWLPGKHDRDLLRGVAKHGLFRSDQLIYNDRDLCFKETVPQTALFDPTTNQALRPDDRESSSEEEEEMEEDEEEGGLRETEGTKTKSSGSGSSTNPPNPVPLGWPKEKAIVIRMTRIVYAFRNKVWPRPMEGLDLFTPVVRLDESSSESSESEEERNSDSDYQGTPLPAGETWRRRPSRGQRAVIQLEEDPLNVEVDVEDDRDFEIEKSQGLKLTLKKATKLKKIPVAADDETPPKKLEVRIPLIQLSFPSVAGMKRIPKKRSAPTNETGESPEAKRAKTSSVFSASSKNVVIIDPTKVSFTDLTGLERVGVINRNTKEKLPLKQSPMLKNLRLWLEGHPHYNVEHAWGPLVIEWGALKPDMYHRILQIPTT